MATSPFIVLWIAKGVEDDGRMPIVALPASGSLMCTTFDGQECVNIGTGKTRWAHLADGLDWNYDVAASTATTLRRMYHDGRSETVDAETGFVLARMSASEPAPPAQADLDALFDKLPTIFSVWLDGWREAEREWMGYQNAELCTRADGSQLLLCVMADKRLVAIDIAARSVRVVHAGVFWVPRQLNARVAVGLVADHSAVLALDLDTLAVHTLPSPLPDHRWLASLPVDVPHNVACAGLTNGDIWCLRIKMQ